MTIKIIVMYGQQVVINVLDVNEVFQRKDREMIIRNFLQQIQLHSVIVQIQLRHVHLVVRMEHIG